MTGVGVLGLIEFDRAGIGVIREECRLIVVDEVAEQESFGNDFHGTDLRMDGLRP